MDAPIKNRAIKNADKEQKEPAKPALVKVRVGNQAIHENGVHHAAGSECELPGDRVAALGSLVTRIE